jgi:chitodextrinase
MMSVLRRVSMFVCLLIVLVTLVLVQRPAAQTANCAGVATWNATTIYNPGDLIVFNGKLYKALIQIWNAPPDYCPTCGWYQLVGTCGSGGNNPPSVSITSPSNGATFAVGTSIPVSANASDSDGSITRVRFLDGPNLIAEDTTAPYSIQWTNASAGTHTITAIAIDNNNASTTSASVTITVGNNNPPPPPNGFPAHVFAPYVDILLGDFDAFKLAGHTSNVSKFFTLAFIVEGGNCEARWGGIIPLSQDGPLASDISALRAAGGDVIVSFGGATGIELAQSCSTDAALLAQYQAVVSRYNLKRVDFDVEGAAAGDPTSRSRRNRVLRQLRANNPGLQIQYTLPVLPSGLTDGVALLQDANSNGFIPDIVNVMAMDYGSSFPSDMGQNAIDAVNNTVNQLRTVFPGRTTAQYFAMMGVTPMIGVNDVTSETFQLSDATDVLNFARSQGVGLIAMWSANRDHQCAANETGLFQCSRITQSAFAFSGIFKGFTQ